MKANSNQYTRAHDSGTQNNTKNIKGKVALSLGVSGPHGWSLTRSLQHEATRKKYNFSVDGILIHDNSNLNYVQFSPV